MSSQSGFFERLRRPRTSTAGRDDGSGSRLAGTSGNVTASSDDVTTRITSRNQGENGAGGLASAGSRLNQVARAAGLPRSSSSSQVHRYPSRDPVNESSSASGTPRKGARAHRSSNSQSNILFPGSGADNQGYSAMSRSSSSQSNAADAASPSGFTRMFRRYSHGPGRAQSGANETRAAAASAAAATSQSPTTPARQHASGSEATSSWRSQDRTSREIARLPASSTLADITASNDSSNAMPLHDRNNGSTRAAAPTDSAGRQQPNTSSRANGAAGPSTSAQTTRSNGTDDAGQLPPVHRIRLVPNLEATRSLHFEPIERDVVEGAGAIKIGRFTDRGQQTNADLSTAAEPSSTWNGLANGDSGTDNARRQGIPGARGGAIPNSAGGAGRVDSGRIAFKSKVVSRGHAEIWCEAGGKFYMKDTKSSSGTFLNHIRLSSPNSESRPHQIKDGDVVQLGVDYQGGLEAIYRCVKMRVELNRGWQRGANEYNINALRQLDALRGTGAPQVSAAAAEPGTSVPALPTNREALSVTDCCICLYSVSVCQALFIAPCSHVYHYKCIRPLINRHFPGFQCPLCRTFADLEAEVERDDAWQEELLRAEIASREDAGRAALDAITPREEVSTMSFGTAAVQAARNERGRIPPEDVDATVALVASSDAVPRQNTESSANRLVSSDERSQSSMPENPEARNMQRPSDMGSSRVDEPENPLVDSPRSNPIAIRGGAQAASLDGASTQRFMLDGFPQSPGLNDAGTPMNEHFLSTLAEAPPPPHNAMRSLAIDITHRGSVGDVYSTPMQGNSPLDTSTVDASLMARENGTNAVHKLKAQSGIANATVLPLDAKGKAPQMYKQARNFSPAQDGVDGGGGASAARSSFSTPGRARSSNRRASMRRDHSASGDSSRDTHRTGESGDSISGSASASRSGSGSHSGHRLARPPSPQATGDEVVTTPSSPASSGKVARFLKRASTAVHN